MNPEEKSPSSSSMSQRIEDISTLKNESDEKKIVTDSSHQNNPSSTKRGLKEMSEYHNEGMVQSANLVTDMSQLNRSHNFLVNPNFVYEADKRSLMYGPNSNSPRTKVHMGGLSLYPSHGSAFYPPYEVDNSFGENQLTRELETSGNISLECPQKINSYVQTDWPINRQSRTLPPTSFQNVNNIGIGGHMNINGSVPNFPENLVGRLMHLRDGMHTGILSNANNYGTNTANHFEAGFLSEPSGFHHNILGRSVLNTAIGVTGPSAFPQINSMQNMVSGIYGDYDNGMMSGSNHEIILGPPYDLQRAPRNDEHHYFKLNSENLDTVSTAKMAAGFSALGPPNSFQGDPNLSLSKFRENQAGLRNLGLNFSSGGRLTSSSAEETAGLSLSQQLQQMNMNYIRNMSPHPSMDAGPFHNTRQLIIMNDLPGQAPVISHENNLTQQIWRKRNLARHPMPGPPPQRQKRQADPPFFPQAVTTLDQTLLPADQIVHSLQMLPSPRHEASPAFYPLPRRNTTPSFAPLSHTSSSPPLSAAQFPPQFSQSPSTLPSVYPQASTALSPLSKGKGISPVLQSPRTFSPISHRSLNTQSLARGPTVSFRPQAYAAKSQSPTMRGPSLNRPSTLRPAASAVQTLHRVSKETPSLRSPPRTAPVFHIKRENQTPQSLGHKCLLCKRDLAYNAEGPISLQASSPGVAVLPCGHTFHDECLKKITPDNDAANPPCIPCAVGES